MSTHNDWRAAKERRDDMAIRAARALLADDLEIAKSYALAYDAADTGLHRIGQELDGGK